MPTIYGNKYFKYWLAFFIVKLFYMGFALIVITQVTQLGDTERYLNGPTFGTVNPLANSTYLMDFTAGGFSRILGPVLANIPFLLLSFYGIYYSVKRLNLTSFNFKLLLLLLSVPSFGIWTSIASKEAVVVFSLGLYLGCIIDFFNRDKLNIIAFILSFSLLVLFKYQYSISLLMLFVFVFYINKFRRNDSIELILTILLAFTSILILYVFRDKINDLSFKVPAHFSLESASTRENTFWLEKYDIFWSAPYGMFISFIGPTFSEALRKPFQMLVFIESAFIAIFIIGLMFRSFIIDAYRMKLNLKYIGLFIIPVFWLLFVHYPVGILNPGSAIRYRSGFYAFICILFFFTFLNNRSDDYLKNT